MSETARYVYDIPVRPREPRRAGKAASARACDIKGCPDKGEYRAPKSRENLDDYRWLCLNHVRVHNLNWDFFRGMSDAEVASYIEGNIVGHRPTWTLGEKTANTRPAFTAFQDAYGLFGRKTASEPPRETQRTLPRLQREALETLGLEETASLNDVKARYKELVKRFHPDANGGDRSCEEQLKRVIRAYRILKASNFA